MKLLKQSFMLYSLGLCSSILLMMTGSKTTALETVERLTSTPNPLFVNLTPNAIQASSPGPFGNDYSGEGVGAGARDDCPVLNLPVFSLMPYTNWSQTISPTPTLWIYIPYASDQGAYGEFRLQQGDEDLLPLTIHPGGQENKRIRITIPDNPGFVPISIPNLESELSEGVDYRWFVYIYCKEDQRVPIYVSGWFQYNSPSDAMTVELRAGDLADYQIYWNHKFWLDAINALMQQRVANPNDDQLMNQWIEFLNEGRVLSAVMETLILHPEPNP